MSPVPPITTIFIVFLPFLLNGGSNRWWYLNAT
jgi:hypothetical protein